MRTKLPKSLLYVYIVPIILIVGVIIAFGFTIFYTSTTFDQNGKVISTNWGRKYAQHFLSYIECQGSEVKISEEGIASLKENACWIQVINAQGDEVTSVNKPYDISSHYTPFELLLMYQNGTGTNTAIVGEIDNTDLVYIIGCPVQITKAIYYVDRQRYESGKMVIIGALGITFILVLGMGILYCIILSRHLNRINHSLEQISQRHYQPSHRGGFLGEIYEGLNELDDHLATTEQLREKNEAARSEWIANITHDLKTPMAPIKGYTELLLDQHKVISMDKVREYSSIIFKNVLYVEQLMNDLKLTYQLKSGMLPIHDEAQDFVRFIKEVVIDLLNTPEYAKRNISFQTEIESCKAYFDGHLLKRAINNLIINALVHNDALVEIQIKIICGEYIQLWIEDNGKGMDEQALSHLFERYYRGTNTEAKPEGTGLGMAIAKEIIEAEHGSIAVHSTILQGTSFLIQFPQAT